MTILNKTFGACTENVFGECQRFKPEKSSPIATATAQPLFNSIPSVLLYLLLKLSKKSMTEGREESRMYESTENHIEN